MGRIAWKGTAGGRCPVVVLLLAAALSGCARRQVTVARGSPAEAAPAGPTLDVRGEVFKPDGRPAAACDVLILHRGPDGVRRLQSALTDHRGAFAATVPVHDPAEPVHVLAYRSGLAFDQQGVERGSPALLRLGAHPKTCGGKVVDTEGRPVAGARVSLANLPFSRSGGYSALEGLPGSPWQATTAADGRFAIGGLTRTSGLSLVAHRDGYARRTFYAGRDADPAHLLITLRPEGIIRGRVVRDGQPVSGVAVFCTPQAGTKGGGQDRAITARDGAYALRHLWFGTFNVMVEPPPGLSGAAITGVELAEGQDRTIGDIRLTAGAIVRGCVTDVGTGKPVEGVRLYASGPGRPRYTGDPVPVFSAAGGGYELRLPPGESRLALLAARDTESYHAIKGRNARTVSLAEGQTITDADLQVRSVPRGPDQVPLALSVSAIPEGGTISAYEPLILRVALTNGSTETAQFQDCGSLNWRLQVRDARGSLVAASPRELMPYDLFYTVKEVKPGDSVTTMMVASALYTFSEPGDYEVRIQRLRVSESFPVMAEASAQVHVLPFDRERLDRRCRELRAAQRTDPDLPWFRALCSIRHDTVLPYLDEWAGHSEACRALLRIGSPKALATFRAWTQRKDQVGRMARRVRDEPPHYPHEWPMGVF